MKKKFSEIVGEERAEAQRQSRRDNTILTVMLVFMGLVIAGGVAFNYFWDVEGAAPKETVSSFEKANPGGADGAEVSLMESNCIESVRDITESPDAVVAEILYKNFPWANDTHVATEFVADKFMGAEMKVVLEQSPKIPFICKSLNISGTDIEVTYQK